MTSGKYLDAYIEGNYLRAGEYSKYLHKSANIEYPEIEHAYKIDRKLIELSRDMYVLKDSRILRYEGIEYVLNDKDQERFSK